MPEENNQNLTAEQEKEQAHALRRQQSLERAMQRRQQEKEAQEKAQQQKGAAGSEGKEEKGIRQATAKALSFSWLNIIDTFGLTLLYINFHFIAKYIAGSQMFSEFGEEWTPAQFRSKTASEGLKIGEIMLMLVCDIILVILIFLLLLLLFIPVFLSLGLIQLITLLLT